MTVDKGRPLRESRLSGFLWFRLPMVRFVYFAHKRWYDAHRSADHVIDEWFDELQGRVCERVRFDVYAEWVDPRERWRA